MLNDGTGWFPDVSKVSHYISTITITDVEICCQSRDKLSRRSLNQTKEWFADYNRLRDQYTLGDTGLLSLAFIMWYHSVERAPSLLHMHKQVLNYGKTSNQVSFKNQITSCVMCMLQIGLQCMMKDSYIIGYHVLAENTCSDPVEKQTWHTSWKKKTLNPMTILNSSHYIHSY